MFGFVLGPLKIIKFLRQLGPKDEREVSRKIFMNKDKILVKYTFWPRGGLFTRHIVKAEQPTQGKPT